MMRSIIASRLKVRFLVLVACTWLALSGGGVMAQEKKVEDFNPKSFDGRSATIDNEWFPLKPGTRLVYAGTTIEDDGKAVPRRLVSIVTDLTKVIDGVRTVVVWDVTTKTAGWRRRRSPSSHRTTTATSGSWVSTPRNGRPGSS